jgi:hypothetical protein
MMLGSQKALRRKETNKASIWIDPEATAWQAMVALLRSRAIMMPECAKSMAWKTRRISIVDSGLIVCETIVSPNRTSGSVEEKTNKLHATTCEVGDKAGCRCPYLSITLLAISMGSAWRLANAINCC